MHAQRRRRMLAINQAAAAATGRRMMRNPAGWYKDTSACQGLYNQGERDKQIRLFCSSLSPSERTVRVSIPSSAEASRMPEMDESPSKFFVCFGFSQTKPFYMPGTIVEFNVDDAARQQQQQLRVTIAGTVVAEGKRTNEYALAICFQVRFLP